MDSPPSVNQNLPTVQNPPSENPTPSENPPSSENPAENPTYEDPQDDPNWAPIIPPPLPIPAGYPPLVGPSETFQFSDPHPDIVEWSHLAPPPVIELTSSPDESDHYQFSDDEPYGPEGPMDDEDVWLSLRRSKRIWDNVNKDGGKRINYFPKKKRRGN